jgi:hypothetical protein
MFTNLRLYAFCNFYLSSIQQGIQTAHVIGRMAKFYKTRDSGDAQLFWQWLEQGQSNETIIVLNGGMAADVEDAYRKFEPKLFAADIPTGIFYEEPRAMSFSSSRGAPTCWATVLPSSIYNAVKTAPGQDYLSGLDKQTPIMFLLNEFLDYKNSCSFAQ